MIGRFCFLPLLCLGFLITGCHRPIYIAENETATTLTLCSTKTTNDGAPLYVVLRFTDFPHFLIDDYLSIADFSITASPNSTHYSTICLLPGKSLKVVSKPPPGQSIGIYCLYTNCGERWKYLIDANDIGKDVKITLGEHEILLVQTDF